MSFASNSFDKNSFDKRCTDWEQCSSKLKSEMIPHLASPPCAFDGETPKRVVFIAQIKSSQYFISKWISTLSNIWLTNCRRRHFAPLECDVVSRNPDSLCQPCPKSNATWSLTLTAAQFRQQSSRLGKIRETRREPQSPDVIQ